MKHASWNMPSLIIRELEVFQQLKINNAFMVSFYIRNFSLEHNMLQVIHFYHGIVCFLCLYDLMFNLRYLMYKNRFSGNDTMFDHTPLRPCSQRIALFQR